MPRGSNPGLTRRRLTKLMATRAAEISSTSETATSPTSNRRRNPLPPAPIVAPRADSFSAGSKSVREACIAGKNPTARPVPTASPSVKPSAVPSKPSASGRDTKSAMTTAPKATRPAASSVPSKPAASESSRLSPMNWRMRRPRPAPSAIRIAVSRRRLLKRASSRLAMLAQAMRCTSPTAPSSVKNAVRCWPTNSSRNVINSTEVRASTRSGNCLA